MSVLDVTTLKSKLALTPTVFKDKDDKEVGTLCRAWVNFNGTGTPAIRASFNVTSVTDNGTGDYTINFTNAMPDANYAWSGGSIREIAGTANMCLSRGLGDVRTTTALQVRNAYDSDAYDVTDINVIVFR